MVWKPANSSYFHAIQQNKDIITVLKPGLCNFTLNRLMPDTPYTIKVESRKFNSNSMSADWSCDIDFRTAEGVRPEPPLFVSGELNQEHLQVSWLPVTINEEVGESNGSIVTGYNVYIENEPCASVTSPTCDIVNIPLLKFNNRLRDLNKCIEVVVRTQSTVGESENSNISSVDMNRTIEQKTDKRVILNVNHDDFLNSRNTTFGEVNEENSFETSNSDVENLDDSFANESISEFDLPSDCEQFKVLKTSFLSMTFLFFMFGYSIIRYAYG